MSHKEEINLQLSDDKAYEKWLMSTPEYWSQLTNTLTAQTKNAGQSRKAKGEIHLP